ncbi:hypothetical protein [Thermogymnomonas acidicola]|uniref:hypothetical protein n=1 Tax=Thermogymnomonas acidicola TaxID=399579 RepID=UPI00094686F6|nr:hypothetical protein [Thermogymnomonas acidicola]
MDLGAIRAFVSLLIGLDKPVFTIVNGDAINEGYEIAMLGDVVIASEGSMLGLSPGYRFSMCGSLSMSRSRRLWISRAEAGVNCDIVLPRERFLEDARSIMEENKGFQFHLMRRARFSNFREALDAEHLAQVT